MQHIDTSLLTPVIPVNNQTFLANIAEQTNTCYLIFIYVVAIMYFLKVCVWEMIGLGLLCAHFKHS
jgi:hypothetical protein